MKTTLLIVSLIFLSACAKAPEDIAAVNVDEGQYNRNSCSQLKKKELALNQELENLSAKQNTAKKGDAWGVFLIGLPTSTMAGNDQETAIAVTKGKIQAIETQKLRKRCS
jgi:hypothetical protein